MSFDSRTGSSATLCRGVGLLSQPVNALVKAKMEEDPEEEALQAEVKAS